MNREVFLSLLRKYFPDAIIKIYENENKVFIITDYIEAQEELTNFLLRNCKKWSVSTDGDNVTLEILIK